MAPLLPSTKIQLSFPPYACDFDPQDPNRLVVGGGGGPGRSGVSNKIAVLNVSNPDDAGIQVEAEVELSRDEDSVNTIAVGPRRSNSILVYAGINSSVSDIEKGKNEHFRVFSADQPSKSKAKAAAGGPKIAELSRSSLFSSKDTNAYQRLLRISQPTPGSSHQLGAIATGDAKDAQIVLFDISSTAGAAPKLRGKLELEKEAVDLDVLQVADDEWRLIYCSGYDVYTMSIGTGKTDGPKCVFTMPTDESTGQRPTFRSIRYLTPTFVLATANLPKAGGVILQGFRLPKTPGAEGKDGWARLAISAKLPKTVTRATGMAVRNLSPPPNPQTSQGDAQFVVAVSGQDSSITLYTLDHQVLADISLIVNLFPITTLKAVHPAPISGLAFSHFSPPKAPTNRPQHLNLASIGSMGNTCIVHSLSLNRVIDKKKPSSRAIKGGPPHLLHHQPRYILALKGRDPILRGLVTFMAIFVVLLAVLVQGFFEVKGISSRSLIGARHFTPASWHSTWRLGVDPRRQRNPPAAVADGSSDSSTGGGGGTGDSSGSSSNSWLLADVLGTEKSGNQQTEAPFVFVDTAKKNREVEVEVEVEGGVDDGDDDDHGYQMERQDEGQDNHKSAREWDQLPAAQKDAWKAKLKKAGHWGEEVGEAVFKGVLFGEIAGVVGNIVRG